MPVMPGKTALLQVPKQEGVRVMFGNPGTTELPLMDAPATEHELRYVLADQQDNREKHDADRARSDGEWLNNLGGAVEDRDGQRSARQLVAANILNCDGGIVHQKADGECQATERRQVDGVSGKEQSHDAGKD